MDINYKTPDEKNDIEYYDDDFVSELSSLTVTFSFVLYFVLFGIVIPIMLIKHNLYNILELYLPNLDLIANVITFNSAMMPTNIFGDLYNPTPRTSAAFLSKSGINFIALLGITYFVSRETYKSKSISFGWSIGFLMLLLTYLLPSFYFNKIMQYVYNYTKSNYPGLINTPQIFLPSLVSGIILVISIILFEKTLIKRYRNELTSIAAFILSVPKDVK